MRLGSLMTQLLNRKTELDQVSQSQRNKSGLGEVKMVACSSHLKKVLLLYL